MLNVTSVILSNIFFLGFILVASDVYDTTIQTALLSTVYKNTLYISLLA